MHFWENFQVFRSRLAELMLVTALLCAGCSSGPRTEVRVAYPEKGPLESHFVASGRVTSQTVQVSAREGGQIRSLTVEENREVKRGDALLYLEDEEQLALVQSLRAQLQAARSRSIQASYSIDLKSGQVETNLARARALESEADWNLQATQSGRPEEIRQAEAGLREAEARLTRAASEEKRVEQLFREDVAARSELEAAQAEAKVARAQRDQAAQKVKMARQGARYEEVQAARAKVEEARAESASAEQGRLELPIVEEQARAAAEDVSQIQAQLRAAEAGLGRTVLTAPIDGVVSQILLHRGEIARPGEPVLSLVASQGLWVEADVDEHDAGSVALEQPVKVRISSLPGKEFQGKVVRLAPSLEASPERPAGAKFLKIKVELDPGSATLRPGMDADVEGSRELAAEALLIPRTALVHEGDQDYVFVASGGRAVKTRVKVGGATTERVQILEGLDTRSQVVIERPEGMPDGTPIRVRE